MKTHLFLTTDFPPSSGGIAREYDEITRRWTISKMLVVAPKDAFSTPGSQRDVLPTTTDVRWLWPHWMGMFWKTLWVVVSRRISLIHVGQVLPCGTIAYLLTRFTRIPYIVYVHGMDLGAAKRSRRKHLLASRILRSASHIIANSRYTERLAKEFVHETVSVSVVYPGATQLDVPTSEALESVNRAYQLEGKLVLLTVARLVQRKGVDTMLRAIALLPEHLRAQLRYLVAGKGPDQTRLEALSNEKGLGKVVRFTGFVEDSVLSALYQSSDIFCLVSRANDVYDVEGFGIVYLEAGLFGKPVLAGNSGGIPDAVLDRETGVLTDPLDPGAVAGCLQKLLQDAPLRKRLGEQGRKRAQTLTWETTTKGCETIAVLCQR